MIQRPKPGRERTAEELIRELRDIARIGIVNARRDAEILRQAADWIENAEERLAIMAESMDAMERQMDGKRAQITVTDECITVQEMLGVLGDDEHTHSGLISED